jgi:hypothetical protein
MQVHFRLMLVRGGRQLQLFLAENRFECRSGQFQMQVTTGRLPTSICRGNQRTEEDIVGDGTAANNTGTRQQSVPHVEQYPPTPPCLVG